MSADTLFAAVVCAAGVGGFVLGFVVGWLGS